MASYRNRSRKAISEINVVPYIDVLLVLLIIFMITAPVITQGVKVDMAEDKTPELVQTAATSGAKKPLELLVITVMVGQRYILNSSEFRQLEVDKSMLMRRVMALLEEKPKTRVVVRGAKEVSYGDIVSAVVMLEGMAVKNISLATTSTKTLALK